MVFWLLHIVLDIDPFLMIFAPFESPHSQLSNGAKIIKNGPISRKLWANQVDTISVPKSNSVIIFVFFMFFQVRQVSRVFHVFCMLFSCFFMFFHVFFVFVMFFRVVSCFFVFFRVVSSRCVHSRQGAFGFYGSYVLQRLPVRSASSVCFLARLLSVYVCDVFWGGGSSVRSCRPFFCNRILQKHFFGGSALILLFHFYLPFVVCGYS